MRSLRAPLVAALLAAAALASAAYSIRLSPFPATEVADGRSQVVVSAQVFSDGRAVPDGTQVVFETNLGSFRESVVGTTGGWARATLVTGGVPGIAHVKATVSVGDASGSTCDIEFVKSREELSIARETIEASSTGSLVFSGDTHVIEGTAPDKGVTVRYRDLEIHADVLQLDLTTFTLKAKKAIVRRGRRTTPFDSFSIDLVKRTGYGLTNFSTTRPDSMTAYPGGVAFTESAPTGEASVAQPRLRYGLVELGRDKDQPLTAPTPGDPFEMQDISNAPSTVAARSMVVYARREVQFHRAEVYVNNVKVMRMPLFVVNLNGGNGSPLVTDDILSVNDNQIALNYPHYLTLKPGLTSLVRLRTGQRYGQGLTASRGAFLDYELAWSKGDDVTGGFTFAGMGRSDWDASARQFWRVNNKTSLSFQADSPGGNSLFGSGSLAYSLGTNYQLALNGSQNHSLDRVRTGFSDMQNYSLSLERNPARIHQTPLRLSYGLTANNSQATVPNVVAGKLDGTRTIREQGTGLTARMFSDSINLDKASSVNGSFGATQLYGPRIIGSGLALNGSLSYTRKLSNSASAFVTYNYVQDGLSELVTGRHSLSLIGNYNLGNTTFRASVNKGIGVERLNLSGEASYRLSGLWRVSYTHFVNDSAFGSLTEFFTVLSYRIGWREVGVSWSSRSHRPGLQLLNVNL